MARPCTQSWILPFSFCNGVQLGIAVNRQEHSLDYSSACVTVKPWIANVYVMPCPFFATIEKYPWHGMATRVIAVALIALLVDTALGAGTAVGFYSSTCPKAESIIQSTVQNRFNQDKSVTPALLRMLFHDSFVRGADASILIDSTPTNQAEKASRPNLTIREFDLIDAAKSAVEKVCPGIVSCADIIPLAVRDSVVLAGGPSYQVPTGRRDGRVSLKTEADNLPSPDFPLEQAREAFFEKGLNTQDYVTLLGAHTVGVALCGFFNDRLFNFHGTGAQDHTMNASLAKTLAGVCPNPFFSESNADPAVSLDQGTPSIFDTSYYSQLLLGNGILQVDQELTGDNTTLALVNQFLDRQAFFQSFVQSITKMSEIGVLTGTQGEIRQKCNAINSLNNTTPSATTPLPAHHPSSPPSRHSSLPSKQTPPSPSHHKSTSPKRHPSHHKAPKPHHLPVKKKQPMRTRAITHHGKSRNPHAPNLIPVPGISPEWVPGPKG
eukprot:c6645_g1_i1 orf=395-1873(-)